MGIFDSLTTPKQNTTTTAGSQTTASASTPWAASLPLWQQTLSGVQGLAGRNPVNGDWTKEMSMARGIARGGDALGDAAYSHAQGILSPGYASQVDPELQAVLDANAARTASRVGSSMAGLGRSNGSAYADVTARAINESTAPLLAQNLQQRRAEQRVDLRIAVADLFAQFAQLRGSVPPARGPESLHRRQAGAEGGSRGR